MRKKITAAQAAVAGLIMFAVLVAGPYALAQDLVWNTFMGAQRMTLLEA